MNAYHRGAIAAAFRSIDKRLAEVEAILLAVGGQSPLSGYAFDVGPMERQAISGYLQRIREKMWSAMKQLDVPTDGRCVSAAWAIRTTLIGVMIDLAEIEPRRLGGYGNLAPGAGTTLAGILTDLQRLTNGLETYVRRAQGENLAERLARLETSPADRDALATIERIITRHGLVELRPTLDMVLSRLESTEFEIAFFGRVSSGKSSLLNYLLGCDVLPVGVLPVTAVLTRLRPADRADMVVRFQISQPQRRPVERIAEFVTEEGNPDNRQRVTEVEVYLPSPRLAQGVAFIDTPGVGSLATCGAAQTKAYLPRCDLGVLLVDAGSSLNHEDLAILQGFYDSAIPTMVLLSKADLLSAPDRNRVIRFIRQKAGDVVGDTPVFAVSTRSPDAALADSWFNEQIVPVIRHHREHAAASLRRKIANLAEVAASYLAGMLDRARARAGHPTADRDGARLAARGPAVAQAQQVLAADAERMAAVATLVTEPTDKDIADQVAHLVQSASAALVERAASGEGPRRALAEHVLRALSETADATHGHIARLGQALGASVRQLSATFGLPTAGPPDEVVATLAPLPPVDEARLRDLPDLRCPRLLAVWPRLACWFMGRRIRTRCGAMLRSLLSDHRAKLRAWLAAGLERLASAYEAHAALLRDRLRAADDGQPGGEPVEELQADLKLLQDASGSSSAALLEDGAVPDRTDSGPAGATRPVPSAGNSVRS